MSLLTQPKDLIAKQSFKGLIYGQPGVGKSTLALSSPNPVCLDLDRGMNRVEAQYRVPSLQVESYKQILDFLNSDEVNSFDTIVIDTLGKLVDRIGDYLCLQNPKVKQSDGSLSMKGWGGVKIEFQRLFKILDSKNKSLIFVSHEKPMPIKDKAGNDIIFKSLDVSGSSGKDIVKELDFMGYMEIIGGKRMITFAPQENLYAKNSLGLSDYIFVSDTKLGNVFISEHIIKLSNTRLAEQAELRQKYDATIKHIDKLISQVKDEKTANEVLKSIGEIEHIWNSNYYAWLNIKKQSETIGLKYNKETKEFTK